MTTTAKRRKYQYRTRQAAEDAVRECQIQAGRLSIALNGMVSGSIHWLSGNYGSAGSYYRFGVVPRLAEQIIVVVFYCPATGQKPHAAAWGERRLQEEIDHYARLAPSGSEQCGYRDGLIRVRQLMNDTRPD